jgi:hypothetical protein
MSQDLKESGKKKVELAMDLYSYHKKNGFYHDKEYDLNSFGIESLQ